VRADCGASVAFMIDLGTEPLTKSQRWRSLLHRCISGWALMPSRTARQNQSSVHMQHLSYRQAPHATANILPDQACCSIGQVQHVQAQTACATDKKLTLLDAISLTERWVCTVSSWSRHQSSSSSVFTARCRNSSVPGAGGDWTLAGVVGLEGSFPLPSGDFLLRISQFL